MIKKKPLYIRIHPALFQSLKKEAVLEGSTMTRLVVEAISEYLTKKTERELHDLQTPKK